MMLNRQLPDYFCKEGHMASIDLHPSDAVPAPVVAPAAAATWGNSAPLALAALAVTTFILSMVNSGIGYLCRAEVCEATYKRSVLPVWPLAAH